MKKMQPYCGTKFRARRGSVVVLVIAMLSVLALTVITLSYTARVELRASENWTEGLQASISTITGLPEFSGRPAMVEKAQAGGRVASRSAVTAPALLSLGASLTNATASSVSGRGGDRSFLRVFDGEDERGDADNSGANRNRKAAARSSSLVVGNLAYSWVEDESGKYNINAILPASNATGGEQNETSLAEIRGSAIQRGTPTQLGGNSTTRLGSLQNQDGGNGDSPDDDSAGTDIEVDAIFATTGLFPTDVLTADQFANFIAAIFDERGIGSAEKAKKIADAIVAYRFGADGKPGIAGVDDNENSAQNLRGTLSDAEQSGLLTPTDGFDSENETQEKPLESDGLDNDHDGSIDETGEGVDETGEYDPDFRRPAAGDDRHYLRIEDLLHVEGMNQAIYDAIAPYLTVFSISRAGVAHQSAEGESSLVGYLQLDPNSASAKDMFNLLTARYADLPEELIGQFVANIVDRRDADSYPSEFVLGSKRLSYHGVEITPYINEVCSDVATFEEDGDNGEFIELINPYSTAIDLAGWRLETGSSTIRLNGLLPSDGLLVITDDADESLDPEPEDEEGMGSLYDIFGTVAFGLNRRIMEDPTFDIPNSSGLVKLYDQDGSIVDAFAYSGGTFNGLNHSFQRLDPRVRTYQVARGTPLERNQGTVTQQFEDKDLLALVETLHNRPFRSPLEILLVSTSYITNSSDADLLGEQSTQVTSTIKIIGATRRTRLGTGGAEVTQGGEASEENSTADDSTPDSSESIQWRVPDLYDGGLNNFDASVMDSFMPGAPPLERVMTEELEHEVEEALELARIRTELRAAREADGYPADTYEETGELLTSDAIEAIAKLMANLDLPEPLHGKININTAPPAILASMPGFGDDLAKVVSILRDPEAWSTAVSNDASDASREGPAAISSRRRATSTLDLGDGFQWDPHTLGVAPPPSEESNPALQDESDSVTPEDFSQSQWYRAISPQSVVRWSSLSEFIQDDELWGDASELDRLSACFLFSRMITFQSLSYKVTTRNVGETQVVNGMHRRPSIKRAERILAADRGKLETVSFRYLTRQASTPSSRNLDAEIYRMASPKRR